MGDDPFEQRFTMATLVAVTGMNPGTFRSWRNRVGLFPETKGDSKWKRFSVFDICIVVALNDVVSAGIPAKDAVWLSEEPGFRTALKSILTGAEFSSCIGFFRTRDGNSWFKFLKPEDTIAFALEDMNTVLTIVNLAAVVTEVRKALPAALATEGEG